VWRASVAATKLRHAADVSLTIWPLDGSPGLVGTLKGLQQEIETRQDLTKRGSVRPVAAIAVIIRDFERLILTALIAAISVQSASDQNNYLGRLINGRSNVSGRRRPAHIRKPAQRCSHEKLEMRDRGGEFREATLPVRNFDAEQVLMMAIERVAFKVFVGSISQSNCSTRQHVLDPSVKARLFLLCRVQSPLNCLQNGADAQPVGFSISLGRAGLETKTA
jgi:hypothetical protein